MLRDDNFSYTAEITQEQSYLVEQFLNILFDDSKIDEYWNLISDTDKAMAFGYHDSNIHYGNPREKMDAILELRDTQRKMYTPVSKEYGISKTVRYSEYGEAFVYIFEDVLVPRIYIAPTEAKVYPLRLVIDAKWEEREITAKLKVRVYDDSFRNFKP